MPKPTPSSEPIGPDGAIGACEHGSVGDPDLGWWLSFAVEDGDYEKAVELLEAGATPDEEAIDAALARCDRRMTDLLVRHGASIERIDGRARTRLHGEARLDQAAFLLAVGADVDAADDQGWTPLHGAAAYGNGPLADLLLRAGARADARTKQGKVPADFARVNGHDDLASALDAAAASDEA